MSTVALRKSALKSLCPHLLRPIARFYVDIEFWEGACSPDGEVATYKRKRNQKDFPVCSFEKGRWMSPWPQREKGLAALLKWQMSPKLNKITFPTMNGEKSTTAIKPRAVQQSKLFVVDKPHVTWIGHATCYFQLEGLYFITDPIFSQTCSPIEILGMT